MKILLLVIQFIMLSSTLAFAKGTIKVKDNVLYMSSSNVSGTGFPIEHKNRQVVVTTAHMILHLLMENTELSLMKDNKLYGEVKLVALDLLNDLAVVDMGKNFEEKNTFTLANTNTIESFQLTAIGFPEHKLSKIFGELLPYNYAPNIKHMSTYSPNLEGATGSPVLNSEGQVIGVIILKSDNFATFTSLLPLKNLLSQPPLKCEWRQCFNNEFNRLKQLAKITPNETPNPRVQFVLAQLYSNGTVEEENNQKADEWMLDAAHLGYPPAQYDSGLVLLKKNSNHAEEWFRMAANTGFFAPAQYQLSRIYKKLGFKKGLVDQYLQYAADQGYWRAQRTLDVRN